MLYIFDDNGPYYEREIFYLEENELPTEAVVEIVKAQSTNNEHLRLIASGAHVVWHDETLKTSLFLLVLAHLPQRLPMKYWPEFVARIKAQGWPHENTYVKVEWMKLVDSGAIRCSP